MHAWAWAFSAHDTFDSASLYPSVLCVHCQAALNRQKEQRTAAEQANSRLQGQVAAQQAELDRRQQELEHAMKLWRQEVVSATSSKASATAAW